MTHSPAPAAVELSGISKTYPGGVAALRGIDLAVAPGERLAVVGPSGSGKSTLLRLIAGLERPDAGRLGLAGRPADRLAPARRDVAMVFQNPAVYPHLSVLENLAFGLRARGVGRAEARRRAEEVAGPLGLADLLGRRPGAISGGQRQRVALGRALARRPAVLLLDEPFSALDAPLRSALRADLIALQRREGPAMLHVTHDQAEALALGDRLAVLDSGRLAQVAPPAEVYDRPASVAVASFIGEPAMNLLPVAAAVGADSVRLGLRGAVAVAPRGAAGLGPVEARGSGPVLLGLRPERVALAEPGGPALRVAGRVERVEPRGPDAKVALALDPDGPPLALVLGRAAASALAPGGAAVAWLPLDAAHWFDPATGRRLG